MRDESTDGAEDQDEPDVDATAVLQRQMEAEAEEVACRHKAQKKKLQREF